MSEEYKPAIEFRGLRQRIRSATVLKIALDRFQRDTLRSFGRRVNKDINVLASEAIDCYINDYLKGEWLIECQACDYEWLVDINGDFIKDPFKLTCPKCGSWQIV
ncbi:MAG: hypothetical protein AAB772_01195 [Patescibacteria group bacterium]